MNYKLILSLSLFGLVMALLTVYYIPSNVEPYFWLGIFIVSAYLIAKNAPGSYFTHGLLTSLANCVWITSIHYLLFNDYAVTHAEEVQMSTAHMPFDARTMQLLFGPVIGVISGIVLGLFSVIASKLVKPRRAITF